jgi:hypothetical protein
MPHLTVEGAGRPWHAGTLQRRNGFIGVRSGNQRVGEATLPWEFATNPFRVLVTHPGPVGGGVGGNSYPVPILTTPLPTGGERWWFGCPRCARRVDLLYLPPGADRLGCRKCCRLVYRCQQTRRARRRRTRRTRRTITVSTVVREYWVGPTHVRVKTRRMICH